MCWFYSFLQAKLASLSMWRFVAVILLAAQYVSSETRLSSLRFPIVAQNRVINITASCNATNMNITVHMEKTFKGLLSAKDFSQECRSMGSKKKEVSILIPTSGCGVRMTANSTDGNMYYSVSLIAQQDRFLRQITDQETHVRCRLRDGALTLKSEPMFEALKTEVNQDLKDFRTGRMKKGWKQEEINNELDKELESVLGAARAWMEISPVQPNSKNSERVQVGEPTVLAVKSTLPAGIGWRVVNCTAHDGIGEVSQRLLDTWGCPLDVSILPALQILPPKTLSRSHSVSFAMRHQEAVASFPAFKFPDRDRLHVQCVLVLCRGRCPQVNCSNSDSSFRIARVMEKGQPGEILDKLEVFNSVEVLAPGIELEDPRSPDLVSADGTQRFSPDLNIPGDRPFCVSPNKMAIAFCILGIVFLVAVVVALGSLMRARRSHRGPYYTRSLFSSSSGASYGGSKLLLQESPTMGQTRHWRIL